ncbi:Tubulin-folding cofactor B [Geodia barretti]|uniref:Tubulin-folding cofactor B n=1 Tax=Geodia barretti TaxID=519541 RepID=A0AA35TI56_GEOBA|nr:Tubulin-folding cofactor B [Geodia barretti]
MAGGDGERTDYLSLVISSSLTSFGAQKRFPASTTVGELKGKLELITGATASLMQLQLFNGDEDKLVCELTDDAAPLGSTGAENGWRINVVDRDPSKKKGEFEDLSKVQKYEMSKDDYAKRTGSALAFKEKMKLGQFADRSLAVAKVAEEVAEKEKKLAEAVAVGARCEVTVGDSLPKRGTVMFVGLTKFKPGYWVGVKYDEPVGKNDGSVFGERYFECQRMYGAFVKPTSVKTGDFPEESFSDDEM